MTAVLLLLLTAAAWAQNTGRIEGRVVSTTGEPVRKATIRLQATQAGPAQGFVDVSSADGSFAFPDMPAGRYQAIVEKPGFTAGRVAAIAVASGQTYRDLLVTLAPLAVLAGRVLDEDGDPVPGARVSELTYRWDGATRTLTRGMATTADDRGEFRLSNLAPGRHYLLADDPAAARTAAQANFRLGANARMISLSTYYPSETDSRRASGIDAKAGQEVLGLVIRLRRGQTYAVRGRAVSVTNEPLAGTVSVLKRGDWTQTVASASMRTPGDAFQLVGLPAGDYTLQFSAANPSTREQGLTAWMDVTVNADIDGLQLRASSNLSIRGRMSVDGRDDFASLAPTVSNAPTIVANGTSVTVQRPGLIVTLSTTGSAARSSRSSAVAPDGTFAIQNVAPGRHLLSIPSFPGVYVKSVRAGGRDLMGAPLDLSLGLPGPIEIVLSREAARVTAPTALTYLWPKEPNGLLPSAGIVAPGSGVATAPPGDYYAATFEEVDAAAARNYGFLRLFNEHAIEVSLKEGEQSAVEPRVIPRATVETVLAQLP